MKYYRAPHSKKDVVGKREREREKKKKREGKKEEKFLPYNFLCGSELHTTPPTTGEKEREISSSIRFWWSRLNKSE